MVALSLFPTRVAFVDAQGRLTPEAYRALMAMYGRTGGPIGDQGIDVFGDVFSDSSQESLYLDSVAQPASVESLAEMVVQPPEVVAPQADVQQPANEAAQAFEMVFQPPVYGSAIRAVVAGVSPFAFRAQQDGSLSIVGGTISALALSRAGVSVSLAATTPIVPLSPGDAVTITYTVAPTLNFIPR